MRTEITWPDLVRRLGTPIRGTESHEAYMRMPKAQQDKLKDIGGFVGGTLRGARRKSTDITGRDLMADSAADVRELLPLGFGPGYLSQSSKL